MKDRGRTGGETVLLVVGRKVYDVGRGVGPQQCAVKGIFNRADGGIRVMEWSTRAVRYDLYCVSKN